MSLRDLIDAYRIADEILRGLARDRLETIEVAFGEIIPDLEAFDRVLQTDDWKEIGRQGEAISDVLESIVHAFERDNIDTGVFPELARLLKNAGAWQVYSSLKDQYQKLSPMIIEKFKRLHKQVKERLSN